MKRLALILSLCLLTLCSKAQSNAQVTVYWNYPTNAVWPYGVLDTSLGFVLLATTNLALPISSWTVATNQSVTTATTNGLDSTGTNEVFSCPLQVKEEAQFFVMEASNMWGLGPPSNQAFTPPAPGTNNLTKITHP